MTNQVLPYDPGAEEAVIGCCLFHDEPVRWVVEWLNPSDFYLVKWQSAVMAITSLHNTGQKCDPITVASEASRLGAPVSAADLLSALGNAPAPSEVSRYGHIVRRHAVSRSAVTLTAAYQGKFRDPAEDPDRLLDELMADLRSIDSHVPTGTPEGYYTFEDLLAKPAEARSPWVLKGLLRKDWRGMFVGPEGSGKTLLLRQVAYNAASGQHVFTPGVQADPVRTLLVDLENPEDHLIDWVDRLAKNAERWRKATAGRGAIWHRPGGIDLRRRIWRGQFEEVLRDHKPDLVCLGPLYKSFRRKSSETEEEAAGEMQEILDDLRTRFGFALVMEHHAPKGQQGVRDLAPFGSSLWLRWGEIRMSLVPPDRNFPVWEMSLKPFSGSRVDHGWPNRIDRNRDTKGIPWLGHWDNDDEPL